LLNFRFGSGAMVRAGPAAAPSGSTCPWGDRGSEDSSVPQPKPGGKPPRSTCPWGADAENAASHGRKHHNVGDQSTSPWTGAVKDVDSERLGALTQKAEVKAQRKQAGISGSAGSGAPKVGSSPREACADDMDGPSHARKHQNVANHNTSPWSGDVRDADSERLGGIVQKSEVKTQRMKAGYVGSAGSGAPKTGSSPASREQEVPAAPDFEGRSFGEDHLHVDEDSGGFIPCNEDDDTEERHQLIRQCIENGLSDDQISEVLDEFHNGKMLEKSRRKLEQQQAQQQAAPLQATSKSVAARRMSKSKEPMSVSFGPSNEEIVGIIREHTPQLSPSAENAPPISLAAKREKAKAVGLPSVGKFNSDESRACFLQGHQQAANAKSKNRLGSGIF